MFKRSPLGALERQSAERRAATDKAEARKAAPPAEYPKSSSGRYVAPGKAATKTEAKFDFGAAVRARLAEVENVKANNSKAQGAEAAVPEDGEQAA